MSTGVAVFGNLIDETQPKSAQHFFQTLPYKFCRGSIQYKLCATYSKPLLRRASFLMRPRLQRKLLVFILRGSTPLTGAIDVESIRICQDDVPRYTWAFV